MSDIPFNLADPAFKDLVRQRLQSHNARLLPQAPQRPDTTPPTEPPAVPEVDSTPRRHNVVAWRHSGPLALTYWPTKESALAHARGLSWAIYWKAIIMCGRDMVERMTIDPPADLSAEQVAAVIGE